MCYRTKFGVGRLIRLGVIRGPQCFLDVWLLSSDTPSVSPCVYSHFPKWRGTCPPVPSDSGTTGCTGLLHYCTCGLEASNDAQYVRVAHGNDQQYLLLRGVMRKRGHCCRPVSVRPEVRLSDTLVYCIQTAEDIVKLFSRPGTPIIPVFLDPERRYPIPRGTPSSGTQKRWGGKILRFSSEIGVYLGNGTG